MENKRKWCSYLEYLIGVRGKRLDDADYQTFSSNPLLKKFRAYSKLETALIREYSDINGIYTSGVSLGQIEAVSYPYNQAVSHGLVITGHPWLTTVIKVLNEERRSMLSDGHILSLYDLPEGIKEEWLTDFLLLPVTTSVGIKTVIQNFSKFCSYYPYQMYVNWNFAETPEVLRQGNLLAGDTEFFAELKRRNEPALSNEAAKRFLTDNGNVCILVDSENSSPELLYELVKDIQKGSVSGIIVVADGSRNPEWDDFVDLLARQGYPVELSLLERLNDHKSLVDQRLCMKAAEEYYSRGTKAFVIASSDSDMWCMISSLPDAKFAFAVEKSKCGIVLTEHLRNNGYELWWLDAYKTDNSDVRTASIIRLGNKLLQDRVNINMRDILNEVLKNIYSNPMPADEELVSRFEKTAKLTKKEDVFSIEVSPAEVEQEKPKDTEPEPVRLAAPRVTKTKNKKTSPKKAKKKKRK